MINIENTRTKMGIMFILMKTESMAQNMGERENIMMEAMIMVDHIKLFA